MRKFIGSFLFIVVIMTANLLQAEIKLPAIISNNMLLQQNINVPIWGWANPGEEISVTASWKSGTLSTKADENGNWKLNIETPKAGGPYTLTFSGENELVVKNVLIGEVWLCSGQSNMEMPLKGWENQPVKNSEEEIENANYAEIRIFTVEKNTSLTPLKDVKGEWKLVTPENIKNFSATAYFFGKELYNNLNIPIGLIHTSWGGTVAEAWTSEKALRELKDFDVELNKIDSIKPFINKVIAEDIKLKKEYEKLIINPDIKFLKDSTDDWVSMNVPSTWEEEGYKNLDGIAWFRTSTEIPSNWKGKDLILNLGPIDDIDITWLNGEKIGETKKEGFYWAQEREYKISNTLVNQGKNELAVRVVDFSGAGGLYGAKNQLKIYPEGSGIQDTIFLSGKWKFKVEKKAPVIQYSENPNRPAALYNAMIAPLVPYSIKGAIWYQGESNVGRAAQYARLFPLMIQNWRSVWGEGDFPFYFAQIAPFGYMGDGTKSASLRNAQRISASKVKNCGMAVLLDIGSLETIHPANKEEVGRRLSLLALDHTYSQDIVSSGPVVDQISVKDNLAILNFTSIFKGLVAGNEGLKSFEIAGEDGNFFPATAIIEANTIIVHAKNVPNPNTVRYAWKDKAIAELFNTKGLPASTFQISVK